MYLFLAFFWLAIGVGLQIFWNGVERLLREHGITADRTVLGFLCFVLFSYNLVRWRMARMLWRARHEDAEARPRRRHHDDREPDPTFDFTDHKPTDEKDRKPPAS